MADFRELLFSKAFKIIPGIAYNQTLEELSKAQEESGDKVLFYEVVLPVDKSWEYLRDKIYPALVRYLKNKSIDPETCKGVIIALFFKDLCYLIEGREFMKVFCEMEDLNSAALHFRILRWLSEGNSD